MDGSAEFSGPCGSVVLAGSAVRVSSAVRVEVIRVKVISVKVMLVKFRIALTGSYTFFLFPFPAQGGWVRRAWLIIEIRKVVLLKMQSKLGRQSSQQSLGEKGALVNAIGCEK